MNRSGALIDTNIVVYSSETERDEAKQARARAILALATEQSVAFVSTQVLIETHDVIARGGIASSRERAHLQIALLVDNVPVLPATARTVVLAADCAHRHRLRIYDAMIWAAAAEAGIPFVLSEDFAHRCEIEGVTFLNPFAPDFDPAELGLAR